MSVRPIESYPLGLVRDVDPAMAATEPDPRVSDLHHDPQVVAHRQVGEQLQPLERPHRSEPGPFVGVEPAHVRGRRTRTPPDVGDSRPVTTLNNVVLPAPFGPISPVTSPAPRFEVDLGRPAVPAELDRDLLGREQHVTVTVRAPDPDADGRYRAGRPR